MLLGIFLDDFYHHIVKRDKVWSDTLIAVTKLKCFWQ